MEVLVGPAFSIDAPAAAAAGAGPPHGLFFTEEQVHNGVGSEKSRVEEEDILSSSSSSSIGAPDDDTEEEEAEDGAVSSKERGVLGSLDSLEDSLPIKRGLSNYFSGKSKSFANLSEVTSVVGNVKEIEKPENPFNKRKRILLANRWASASKRSSFYSWQNPKSMPLLALNEDDQEEQEEEDDDHVIKGRPFSSCSSSSCCSSSSSIEQKKQDPEKESDQLHHKWGGDGVLAPPRLGEMMRFKSSTTPLKSQSCFSLTDLQ